MERICVAAVFSGKLGKMANDLVSIQFFRYVFYGLESDLYGYPADQSAGYCGVSAGTALYCERNDSWSSQGLTGMGEMICCR